MDELLSLLQINIALGILYIGLRGGRYREKLLRSLAELIESKIERLSTATEYDRLAGSDEKFQKRHHTVARWIPELPADRIADIDTVTKRFGTTRKPPMLYRWFRGNWDKHICFTVLTILGIIMTWTAANLGNSALSQPILGIMYGLIALGQFLVSLHVVAGSWMVRHYRDQCKKALNYLETETRAEVFAFNRYSVDSAMFKAFMAGFVQSKDD